ncbi:MAG: Hsp70 family protein [Tepidisphaera sp.]|nr:Hsp70 family protein [Tepidisphaera sp.]
MSRPARGLELFVSEELIVGIDLGTTNSLVAVCDAHGPRILGAGGAMVPSVVRYPAAAGEALVVGEAAKRDATLFPVRTVSSVKRLMGRSATDAAGDAAYLSYEVVAGERGAARVRIPAGEGVPERVLSPEEVSAAVLRELKSRAEAALGRAVSKAVITVPAYFDDAQRQATRVAGRLAGLEVVRLVPEPTAAALAYGIGLPRAGAKPASVMVYDLGGGTFDVSVLRLTPGEGDEPFFFQALAVGGDSHLGGDDFDHALTGVMKREVLALLGLAPDSTLDPATTKALVEFAERVKIRLSDAANASVRIDLGERVYERVFTREEFEALVSPMVERTILAAQRTLEQAREALAGEEISAVVLVGGSTRVPLVRRRVREAFGMEPYTALNPDEVVALGASVQASLLGGARSGALLLDVLPLSLGVETQGGAVAKLIMRNSTVPARAREMFSTSVDGQTSIRLSVYQGEREMAADCRKLGEFHVSGLPPMPAGVPQLEVVFAVDANGVLNVSATERRSGRRAGLQVIPTHGLSQSEVERIERESLLHAREDMTRHRVVDLIVNGKLDLKWIGERLAKHRAELDAAYVGELESRVASLREMIDSAERDWRSVDPSKMHQAKEALDRASMRLQEVAITQSLREQPRKL